jgi:HD-GYP domain-containing protein (c-di-GMP phosphodiesterase class II)
VISGATRILEEPPESLRVHGAGRHSPVGHGAPESSGRWQSAAYTELSLVRDAVQSQSAPRLEECRRLAGALVQELRESDECVRWALIGKTDDYLLDNALHVAVLSVKIGMGMGYTSANLEELALAGLLHDLGMWLLPGSLVHRSGTLAPEEEVAVRAHPERGRCILAGLGSPFASVSEITVQEHERSDGSGYPYGLKGHQIAEPAQIIGLADVFDALITPRPYKKTVAPHYALRELLVHEKALFSRPVLTSLADQITLYPVGTAVRLNSGQIGTVVKLNPGYPLRPSLRITSDQRRNGEDQQGEELDLVRLTSTHIVEVLPAAAS